MAAHATLGASSAERWMTCPGSVILSQGMPDFESGYAREGSAAHALGEHCLLNNEDPFEYLGEPVPHKDYSDIEVPVDMVDAVTVYVNHVRELMNGAQLDPKTIERRVSLEKLGRWAEGMFGTADFAYYRTDSHRWAEDKKYKCLYVRDYKHGAGVAVEVEDNAQLRYYAVGALLSYSLVLPYKNSMITALPILVDVGIVQPRKPHEDGPIRTQTYHAEDLLRWALEEVQPAVECVDAARLDQGKTGWADTHLQPSEKGCQFCRAKGVCPKLAEQSLSDAMLDFDDAGKLEPEVPMDKLTEEQVARILDNEKAIKNWLAGVAALAQEYLEHGQDITGGRYKLVAGRSSRDWKDQKAAEKAMLAFGVNRADLYEEKFVSVAKAEKLIGKDQKKELASYVAKQEGKATLAPAEDKRPALQKGPEADFADDSGNPAEESGDDMLD